MSVSANDTRAATWSGSIPVVLSLAPTSLSSPTMPAPIHILVSRHTYLHVGLRSATRRFHKFAPPVISFPITRNEPNPGETSEEKVPEKPTAEESYPICWFEDEQTQIALRWHLFAGILWDMKKEPKSIPWRIKLHFNNYPSNQVLPMEGSEVLSVVERTFKNSLKQALFLQQGTSKVAMNMSKQSHGILWESILTSNYKLYQEVDCDLQNTSQLLPVRLMIDSKPPIQRPIRVQDYNDATLGQVLNDWAPNLFQSGENNSICPTSSTIRITIQGIDVSLSSKVIDLCEALTHPDHFLYIIVTTP